MDGGQDPVRPEWPLFGGIGVLGRRLNVNDATPRCRSNYLGIGKNGILLYLQGANGKPRPLSANGGWGVHSSGLSAQQASRWAHGRTDPSANARPGRPVGAGWPDRVIAPDSAGGRLWTARTPFGIDEPHPAGPLVHLFRLSWRRHAHSRVGLSAERHFGELGIRFWIQQGTIREELRDSGYVINS